MPSSKLPSPKVPIIDSSTGLISREWYRFFLNLSEITGSENNDASISDLIVSSLNQINPSIEDDYLINVPPVEIASESTNLNMLVQEHSVQIDSIIDELSSLKLVPEIGTLAYQNASDVNVGQLSINNETVLPTIAVYKTSSESRNSTTTATIDSELVVSLKGSSVYRFTIQIFFNTSSAAEGIKLSIGGTCTTASPINTENQVFIWDDIVNTLATTGRIISFGSTTIGTVVSTGDNYASIDGIIQTDDAGTFGLYWAQNVSGANNTTVQLGSNIIVTRID